MLSGGSTITTASFDSQQTYTVGTEPKSVAVGDLNGDGFPDLAVANYGDGTVSVLLGNGDGTFQSQQTFAVGTDPNSVAVANLNGGALPALTVANEDTGGSGTVSVLLNTTQSGASTVSFAAQQTFSVGNSPYDGPGRPAGVCRHD